MFVSKLVSPGAHLSAVTCVEKGQLSSPSAGNGAGNLKYVRQSFFVGALVG